MGAACARADCRAGMGANCGRLDCTLAAEDCSNSIVDKGRPCSLWYDCTGQPQPNGATSSTARGEAEATEVITPEEQQVEISSDRFSIGRKNIAGNSSGQWRRRYILGRELGAGQTAIVFEARPVLPGAEDHEWVHRGGRGENAELGGVTGRRVALKRFNSSGTTMFREEVRALTAVGVHPHVMRLLESFEGGQEEEDALVLEYCDGGDLYELYAVHNGSSMLESFVVDLVRQMLLALNHLVDRGVEHRDVKPENLLLYGSQVDSAVPHLKLADFGWAIVRKPHSKPVKVPPDGVGSLWYAPPEWNPPVDGVDLKLGEAPPGLSDMWSVGIITYLLLVGHSPFNTALRVTDAVAREKEVIRLAALGHINVKARPWAHLSEEARSFICLLIHPQASQRLSPAEAWRHPFIARSHSEAASSSKEPPPTLPPPPAERQAAWRALDGFQRLCWLSFARAIAEPELLAVQSFEKFIDGQSIGSTGYHEQLAGEMVLAATPAWFQAQASWTDVLDLAFHYLDADGDGHLGLSDILRHVDGERAQDAVLSWLHKWRDSTSSNQTPPLLGFREFRRALAASCVRPGAVPTGVRPQRQAGDNEPYQRWLPSSNSTGEQSLSEEERIMERMQRIDAVCSQWVDEEFCNGG